MKTTIQTLFITVNLLAGVATCPAYILCYYGGSTVKWPTDGAVLHAASDFFTAGSDYRNALEAAIAAWNSNPSQFRFEVEYDRASADMNSKNTFSEVWFTNDPKFLSGYEACCTWWCNGSAEITEADIVFDSDKSNWTTSTDKNQLLHYGGENRLFQNVAVHELGHALGLDHENDEYNIMGLDETHLHANGDTVTFYPGEDASDGAAALYGYLPTVIASSAGDWTTIYVQDLGAVHWKWTGEDGEYSVHTRTAVYGIGGYDASGDAYPDYVNPRSYHTYNDEPYYYVAPGESVFVEFTLENNGASEQHPLTKFYYSSNDLITTADDERASRRPGLWPNDVYTITQLVEIPDTAAEGYAYLGVIVDADDALTDEISEENNATYVGILVTNRK